MRIVSLRNRLLQASLLAAGFLVVFATGVVPRVAAQSCATTTTPATTYGQVKQTVNVQTAGTYRVWSRIKASSSANNSYYLQIDNGCAVDVGDNSAIPAGSWTWVNYQNGTTTSFVDMTISAGSHQLTYTGREADVQLDRVLLLGDTTCTPTGTGDNCASVDTVNPTASLTAPTDGQRIGQGNPLTITATAQDNVGVNRVDFLVDGGVVGTVPGVAGTTSYSYTWATASASIGTHSIMAKAYDAAGNPGSSTPVSITVLAPVDPGDHTPPTITSFTVSPTSVVSGGSVTASVTATDNVGVAKVDFSVDGTVVNTDTTAPYSYTWTPTNAGAHSVTATAYDAAGNNTPTTPINLTVTSTSPIPGDVNGDHKVDSLDYIALQTHWGQDYPPAEFDGGHTVGAADLAILLAHFTF